MVQIFELIHDALLNSENDDHLSSLLKSSQQLAYQFPLY